MKITHGHVSIEDGKKANEEFAPARKVRVELHFETPEGGDHDAVITAAGDTAHAHVNRLLGISGALPAAAPATPVKPTATTKKAAAPKTPAAPEPGSKAALEAAAIAELSAPAKPVLDQVTGAIAPAEETDDLSDILGESAPVPISDKELGDACIAKANKMKTVSGWDSKKIRALMEEYTGAPGKRVVEIPAEKRRAFLDALEALK